jgi:hypothetical protein
MRGSHEINVVTPSILKGEHHPRKLIIGHLSTVSELGDIVILTIYAAQVAVGKKDSSRSPSSYKWSFFSKMGGE